MVVYHIGIMEVVCRRCRYKTDNFQVLSKLNFPLGTCYLTRRFAAQPNWCEELG